LWTVLSKMWPKNMDNFCNFTKKPSTNIYHSMVFQNIPIFVIFVMKIFHLATLIESALKCWQKMSPSKPLRLFLCPRRRDPRPGPDGGYF
jgi:hypothetical protein